MANAHKVYGVGVIGCGNMGSSHASAVAGSSRARLIGTVDLCEQTARTVAQRYSAAFWSTRYKDLLDRPEIDVIIIATYPSSHRKLAVAALQAGKHVLLEKPLAPTMAEAAAIVRTAQQTNRKLRVGYILRHNTTYQRAVRLIQAGTLGSPLVMRMFGGEHIKTEAHWRQDLTLITETSPVIDCGCHYVDVMRWATGAEVLRISGVRCRLDSAIPEGCYDYGVITMSFSDGSSGVYEVGWSRAYRNFSEKEFVGPKGRLRIIYAEERPEHHEEGDLIELYHPPSNYQHINVPGDFKPLKTELEDLLNCIAKDLDPMPALVDAMRSLQIVLAGHRALLTGKSLTVKAWQSQK
jgi:predicted dehydrogenase